MKEKRIKIQTIVKAGLILLAVYLIFVGLIVYFFPKFENIVVSKTVSIIPYPAVVSNFGFITIDKLHFRLSGAKKFYESQDFSKIGFRVDFGTEDGKKRLAIKEKNVLNKLINDAIIEAEAKRIGLVINRELIDQEVDRKLKEYGTGNYLKNNLEKLYGWDISDFKENIVKPDLYQEKLFAEMKKTDSSFEEARKKINQAKNELSEKVVFSEVAKKYSEGESAKNGGALGWFNSSQMLPEVAQAIFPLEKGQQSEVIESSIGFHIILVEDKKNQNNENMIKISQIFVPTKTFAEWLTERKSQYKIFIPLDKYFWDKKEYEVRFENEVMEKYEKDLLENPINDPSIIF